MSAPSRLVLTEPEGRDATIVMLNRPDKRNALSIELLEQLVETVAAAERDPAQRILHPGRRTGFLRRPGPG
jgi:enoyl-CoA hydratase/carnithine racemase